MQTSLPSRCEGRPVGLGVCLNQRISTAIKPVEKLPMKRMSRNSRNVYLHSTLKPSLGIQKYYGKTSKSAWPVNSISNTDKGGESITDKRKRGGSYNVLSVFGGVICNMIKGVLNFLSLEKNFLAQFEDKIENATDMVEEVAETVKQVANFTEDIAEKVEQQSKDGAVIHEAAEFVDNLSEKLSMEAEIVDNAAEQIKKSLKSISTNMDEAEDAVDDIEDRLSKAIVSADERPIGKQNSREPEVISKKE